MKRTSLVLGLLATVAFGAALLCFLAYARNASFSVAAGGGPSYVATAERLIVAMLVFLGAGLGLTALSVARWPRTK